MLTFRTSTTLALMTFITALAGLLIFIQFWTFRLAASEAASARMDAASAETLGRLRNEIAEVTSISLGVRRVHRADLQGLVMMRSCARLQSVLAGSVTLVPASRIKGPSVRATARASCLRDRKPGPGGPR